MTVELSDRAVTMARRTAKYVQRFGPSCGLRNIIRTRRRSLAGDKNALVGVRPSRASAEMVWLRPGTTDALVFEQVFVDREYDIDTFPQAAALRQRYDQLIAIGKTPVVIDCGANVGMAALWFQRQFPRVTVVAIEPNPENYRILLRNLAGVPGSIAIQGAVWNTATMVRIIDETAEPWGFQVEESNDRSSSCAIPTVTIEQAVARVANGALFIVKVDIEGSEANLFASNTDWLCEVPLLIIELHDWMLPWRRTSRNFLRVMTSFDRDMVQKGENQFWFQAPPSARVERPFASGNDVNVNADSTHGQLWRFARNRTASP